MFFFGLGSTDVERYLLAGLGVVLELAKRQAWLEWKGREADTGFVALLLALMLSCTSGIASAAFSYTAIQTSSKVATENEQVRNNLLKSVESLNQQAQALQQKLDAMPVDWVTKGLQYSEALGGIAAQRDLAVKQLGEMGGTGKNGENAQVLRALCDSVGISFTSAMLVLLGMLALIMEVATYGMLHGRRRKPGSPPPTLEALVLETAYQAVDKPLVGRRAIAERLHMKEADIRVLLEHFQKVGIIDTRPKRRGYFLTMPLNEALMAIESRD
ncbi:MAG: hypothetical protein WCG80_02500 [Spirochaetales bacterium]